MTQKLQGNDYEIMVDTAIPNKNAKSVELETKQKPHINKIELYKVKDIVVDDKSPTIYVKIGGCGVALGKESIEELIEILKTILK